MELTKPNTLLFNDDHKKIIKELGMKDTTSYMLNGSYPNSLWASDLDLFQVLESSPVMGSKILREIKDKVAKLSKDKSSQFVELKIGDDKFKTVKAVNGLNQGKLLQALTTSNRQRIKLDTLVFVNGYIEDITIIYDLHQKTASMTTQEFKSAMIEDVNKFYKEKNYFKVLKRTTSLLMSLERGDQLSKRLEPLLKTVKNALNNSFNGFIYLTIARLESTKEGTKIDKKLRDESLSNLREDIGIKIGGVYETLKQPARKLSITSIPAMVWKLRTILNVRILDVIDRLDRRIYSFHKFQ